MRDMAKQSFDQPTGLCIFMFTEYFALLQLSLEASKIPMMHLDGQALHFLHSECKENEKRVQNGSWVQWQVSSA